MSEDLRPIVLLHQELTGSLEAPERDELDRWRTSHPENAETAASIEETWRLAAQADVASGYAPDTDAAWARLSGRLSDPEAAPKNRRIFRKALAWSAAAALALLLGVGLWWQNRLDGETPLLVAEAGTMPIVRLSDGTTVHLRDGARLSYPEHFEGSERTVRLEGEAFFEVAHLLGDKLFRVETRAAAVEVLGTAFNVRENADGSQCAVAVRSGTVRLSSRGEGVSDRAVVLNAGEGGQLDATAHRLTRISGSPLNDAAWFSGELLYRDCPLSRVLAEIEEAFGVQVELDDARWAECTFTGSLRREALREHLTALARVFGGRLEPLPSGGFRLLGGGCAGR